MLDIVSIPVMSKDTNQIIDTIRIHKTKRQSTKKRHGNTTNNIENRYIHLIKRHGYLDFNL